MLTPSYGGKDEQSVTGVTISEDYFGDTPTTVGSMGIIGPEPVLTSGGCVDQRVMGCLCQSEYGVEGSLLISAKA
jgi:hypothetical protein